MIVLKANHLGIPTVYEVDSGQLFSVGKERWLEILSKNNYPADKVIPIHSASYEDIDGVHIEELPEVI